MMSDLDQMSAADIQALLQNDEEFVRLCNTGRKALYSSPAQSNFRVYAILVIEKEDNTLCLIRGANSEQGYIGGAICAERAALCSLRFVKNPILRQLVVVTDSETATSPGVLCREFLNSYAQPDTPIIMGNADGTIVTRCPLGDLWPHPYHYRFADRNNVVSHAKEYAGKIEQTCNNVTPTVKKLFSAAEHVNNRDSQDALHPVRFSAAVLFEDGTIEASWMLKGLEYGCTLDPISQLVRDMERKKVCVPCDAAGNDSPVANIHQAGLITKPVILVMCDQFGVAHAPFAQARSLLCEHGYGYVQVLVHGKDGVLCTSTAEELVPQPPGTRLVSCDIFH